MRKHRRPRRAARAVLALALCAALALFIHWSNSALQVTTADALLSGLPEGFDGCRVVVLGDLHTAVFGPDNETLLQTVEEQAPAYIFLVGDLLDCRRPVPDGYVETVAGGLAAIAPTYYVTGNHEWALGGVPALKETLTEAGVTVLSNAFLPLTRNGDTLVLAGVDDPNGYADQKSPETVAQEVTEAWGDSFWMLLAHRNDFFPNHYSLLGADLVISGHGHGGLIRLPFTDGLVSTDHTLFPSYTAGLYEKNGSTLFVTRGLGNSGPSFRLFNRPEIAVLTLHRGNT